MKTPFNRILLAGLKKGIADLENNFGRIVKNSAGDEIPEQIKDTLYLGGKDFITDKATAGRRYSFITFKIK